MKFTNSYAFNFGGQVSGLKEKLQKLLGMESAKTNLTLEGEVACEVSIEEMKELISSENDRIKALRDYIGNGLESDVMKLVDVFGQAVVEAERIQKVYDHECTETHIAKMREDARIDEVRRQMNDERRKAAKEAAEKESEE